MPHKKKSSPKKEDVEEFLLVLEIEQNARDATIFIQENLSQDGSEVGLEINSYYVQDLEDEKDRFIRRDEYLLLLIVSSKTKTTRTALASKLKKVINSVAEEGEGGEFSYRLVQNKEDIKEEISMKLSTNEYRNFLADYRKEFPETKLFSKGSPHTETKQKKASVTKRGKKSSPRMKKGEMLDETFKRAEKLKFRGYEFDSVYFEDGKLVVSFVPK